jgi:hypothetical protein
LFGGTEQDLDMRAPDASNSADSSDESGPHGRLTRFRLEVVPLIRLIGAIPVR